MRREKRRGPLRLAAHHGADVSVARFLPRDDRVHVAESVESPPAFLPSQSKRRSTPARHAGHTSAGGRSFREQRTVAATRPREWIVLRSNGPAADRRLPDRRQNPDRAEDAARPRCPRTGTDRRTTRRGCTCSRGGSTRPIPLLQRNRLAFAPKIKVPGQGMQVESPRR
jgi:hypothetical protein